MKRIILLFVFLTINCFSQTTTRLFPIPPSSPTYSMGYSAPIVQTPDNGYLLTYSYSYPNWDGFPGYTTSIIKTDSNFTPLWSKRTGGGEGNGRKTIVLSDGSSLIFFDSGTILKLGADGQTLFSIGNFTTYPDRLNIADVELIGTTIKVVGTKDIYSFGQVSSSIQVMIDFDTNGTMLQTYVLNDGGTSAWTRPTNICKDNSGNYYITGYSYADGNYICKFNSSNTVVWCRRFSGNNFSFNDIIALSSGDILLAGTMSSVFLCRLSSATGASISAKMGDAYVASINNVSQLSNGDLVATGWLREDDTLPNRIFSMEMDNNEVFSWMKLYNYGFGISAPFAKNDNNWYYAAFHNNYVDNNYPILFNTENTGVTSCPYDNITLNFNDMPLNSSSINLSITPNSSLFGTPSTSTNFYPIESQSYQDECLSLAVNEIDDKNDLVVYPNPSKGTIYLKSDAVIKTVEVNNTLGQKINEYNIDSLESSISIQNQGIYFLTIKTENGVNKTKIIISN